MLERRAVRIEATLTKRLDEAEAEALEGAARRFGAFLGLPAELTVAGP